MAKGTIKRVLKDRGFGFIKPEADGEDVYFRAPRVTGEVAFNELREGMKVEYEARRMESGMQATQVRVTEVAGQAVPRASAARENASGVARPPYRFLNPYNFVRFLQPPDQKVARGGAQPAMTALGAAFGAAGIANERSASRTESTIESRLLRRCAPPPHDRYVGVTGEIRCALETETPLFVSDSENVKAHREHRSYEFFKLDGQPALPATSLRGMVRSVFEAATNSCMAHLTGQRLSQHLAATDARKLWPARVKQENGQWFLYVMDGTTHFSANGPAQGDLLPAAWLMQYSYGVLQPSPTVSYGPNKSKPYSKRTPVTIPAELNHRDECWALIERMTRPDRTNRQGKTIKGFDFWNVKQVVDAKSRGSLPTPGPNEMVVLGWLCITNHNIENKHDERLFFSSGKIPPILISNKGDEDKVIRDYEDLIADYQQRHYNGVKKREELRLDPAQPLITKDKKEAGYSRFILENDSKLHDGDLVYALLEGSGKHLKVKFIVPVSVPRVSYDRSIAKVLEESGPHLKACEHQALLCSACRVFGWVHQNPDKSTQQAAYAGRVRFSHGALVHHAGVLPATPLAILSSPKPTTTRFYLMPRGGLNGEKWFGESAEAGYDDQNNVLRGRKFYRHHGAAREEEYLRAGAACDDQNRTVRDALAPKSRFEFTISFENLAPCELGTLLWTLEMDGRGHHRLGFAKPLGFGSVKITIQDVKTLDPARRYVTLEGDGWQPASREWLATCVQKFKDGLSQLYAKPFEDLDNVRDLRALLNEPAVALPVHYPRTGEDPSSEGRNYEWFMGNNRNQRLNYTLAPATDDKGLPLITRDGIEVD